MAESGTQEASIYLDYAATSPVDPAVFAAMQACLLPDGSFANPASPHAAGRAALELVEHSRSTIARVIGADPGRLVFTSGATEANNIALTGILRRARRPVHAITSSIEHRSVLDVIAVFEQRGVGVTRLACDEAGRVNPEELRAAIRPDTRLVSIMLVNNEIGSVQDIRTIAGICRAAGVPLHVDAAQGAGKIPFHVDSWGVDLCSLTAHKVCGPKGIGALYVRAGLELAPFVRGGAAALGLRAGTLPTHQIAGFGKAFELVASLEESDRLARLREELWTGLAGIPGARRNGRPETSAPHILSVSFPGVEGEALLAALPEIAVSAGSACTSAHPEPSHVLGSLGLSDTLAESTLRFGVGRFTSADEIRLATGRVSAAVARLRQVASGAPDWCSR